MTESILVTGSNRGIGLELVRQYAADGWRVFACCRNPPKSEELNALAGKHSNISIHGLDVADTQQIKALAKQLKNEAIDILLNNTDEAAWLECFHINTIAPMKIMEAFVDNVAKSKRKLIATMSSKMGSMADNGSGGSYIYRSSKAAINAVMVSAAIDLKPKQIKVAILHPGWVLTDMGGPNAEITVEECVNNLRRNLDNVTLANSGTFFEIDGSVIPW